MKTIVMSIWFICIQFVQATQYQVTVLGNLGIEDGAHSTSYGVNNLGQVVGASSYLNGTGGNPHPFLYSNGTLSELGGPSIFGGYAHGINSAGQITGLMYTNDVLHYAFLYSSGTLQNLGTLGGDRSSGNAINNIGQIAGTSTISNGYTHAFLYSNDTMQDLGTLGGGASGAFGINNLGQVVGRSFLPGNSTAHAFLYSDGVMTDLNLIPGDWNTALGINDSGQIVGHNRTPDGDRAFLYHEGITINLGTIDSSVDGYSLALGINNAGQIVGSGSFGESAIPHAFLYSDGEMKDINTLIGSSWEGTISRAYQINELGQIAAEGYDLNGQAHALLLNPIPEPTTSAILFVMATGIFFRRRR